MLRRTCVAVVVLLAAAACRADLPPGFTKTLLATVDELGSTTSLCILPDGRVITGGYYGEVSLVAVGQPVIHLLQLGDVWAEGDHGLLGLCIDPAFASNGYLYIFYAQ